MLQNELNTALPPTGDALASRYRVLLLLVIGCARAFAAIQLAASFEFLDRSRSPA
jgi:hypothetical protein